MPIRRLPPSLVNKIAAGEVIERPASVVKELVENSVDAGASRIDVAVERGGIDLIRVVDDGCGIAAEELPLAVAAHATSKLPDDDSLFHIATLGFRGEALASIAEVSRLHLRSRTPEQPAGAEIVVEGGLAGPVVPCGAPVGTTVEVRQLFFNTPVRRKFLRSVQTEFGHLSEALARIALARPEVHLTLRHNDRPVIDLPAGEGLVERIARLFGRELAEGLISVESVDGSVRISGYAAHPSQSRANNRMQYFSLNGRFIRDRSLQHALGEAYRGLLTVGRYPIAFLAIEMPPEAVDVNVHPTKLEVRLLDAGRLYSQLLSTLRAKFLTTDLSTRIGPAAPDRAGIAAGAPTNRAAPSGDPWDAPPREDAFAPGELSARGTSELSWEMLAHPADSPAAAIEAEQARRRLVDWARGKMAAWTPGDAADSLAPRGDPLELRPVPAELLPRRTAGRESFGLTGPAAEGIVEASEPEIESSPRRRVDPGRPRALQVHDRYLVTETAEGVTIIDQHALHERILYEHLRRRVEAGAIESQRLLVPEPVDLAPAEAAAALEHRDVLAELGLEIEPFGGHTVLVTGFPAMLANLRPGDVLRGLIERILAGGQAPERRDLLDTMLHSIACKAAIKAGDRLSPEEIDALLAERHLVADAHHCPHGRPTALTFTREELDKRFKRT